MFGCLCVLVCVVALVVLCGCMCDCICVCMDGCVIVYVMCDGLQRVYVYVRFVCVYVIRGG